MAVDRRKVVLFVSAATLRFLLFFAFPSLPTVLTSRVEISTPVTSFKRRRYTLQESAQEGTGADIATSLTVQEGLFLYTHNVSPYDGGVFHQASPTIILTVR